MARARQASADDELGARSNPDLVGHGEAERVLLRTAATGRLPHAWLISGPRGIGKATLAYRFARFMLAGGGTSGGPPGPPPESLFIDPGNAVFRRVASGGHADLLTVERGEDEKTRRRRSEIIAGDARAVAGFLHLTPAEGGWRVVVIDSADELNRAAANAILKILEEPPARVLLLLVSHLPSRLLATIRSRCRKLALRPLADEEIARILASRRPGLPDEDLAALTRLAEGSAGRALVLADEGGLALYREFVSLLLGLPRLDVAAVHALGDRLARADAEAAYRTMSELLPWWLARVVRVGAGAGAGLDIIPGEAALMTRLARQRELDRWLKLWEKVSRLFAQADRARLDRKQVLLNVFHAMESTARA